VAFGRGEQRGGDALSAVVRMDREPVQVAAPADETRYDRAEQPALPLGEQQHVRVAADKPGVADAGALRRQLPEGRHGLGVPGRAVRN
jgi:hypothetical protein